MHNVLLISGTSRPENYTARALGVVAHELRGSGMRLTEFDAREISLAFPGQPETDDAHRLREAVQSASAVILATPEYHGSFCAMTKLIIENLGFPSELAGKPVALVGVAAGRIGAIKSLEQLKGVLSHVGAILIPGAVSVAGVRSVFDDDGNCTDAGSEKALRGVATAVVDFLEQYVAPAQRLAELESAVRGENPPWVSTV